VIRFDVYPTRENPTNMTRTLPTSVHVRAVYASCGQSPYVATFYESPTKLDKVTALEKMAPDTIHSMTADQSASPYRVSLPSQPMKQWRKSNICLQPATRLTGPISSACDRYVQYLLTGTKPSVLNRYKQGLPHRNLGIATALSPPFPFECSTSPPK
jgi:hypothetical protein